MWARTATAFALDSDQKVQRYFEPSLAALIVKDQNDAAQRKEVGTLDFDPFVDAQDWDIAAFNVAVSDKGADKASATVTVQQFRQTANGRARSGQDQERMENKRHHLDAA